MVCHLSGSLVSATDTPANVSMNIKIEVQSNGAMLLPLVPVFNMTKSYGCLKIIDLLSGTALIFYNLWDSETSLVSRVLLCHSFFFLTNVNS